MCNSSKCSVRVPCNVRWTRENESFKTGIVRKDHYARKTLIALKQLGQVLAMWLGESENCAENSRRASRLSISHAGKPSQIDMLTIWLEISLVREFKNSCTFSPQNSCNSPENADNDEHASRNIPFRRDNVECLFIQLSHA